MSRTMSRSRTRGPAPAPVAPKRPTRLLLTLFAAAAALTVAVIALGALARRDDDAPLPAGPLASTEGRVKGNANAPVTIIEYSDLQCPNCARFAQTTERVIEQQYIATGVARLESRHFAFLGVESQRAAEACECANEQGKFYLYRDALYANQQGENRGAFSDSKLKGIAGRVGLNTDAFGACLDAGRYRERVKEETAGAKALGVEGTPTFFVNGQPIVGAQPLAVFQAAIERARAGATGGR